MYHLGGTLFTLKGSAQLNQSETRLSTKLEPRQVFSGAAIDLATSLSAKERAPAGSSAKAWVRIRVEQASARDLRFWLDNDEAG